MLIQLLLFLILSVGAIDIPAPVGPLVDEAKLLSSAEHEAVNSRLLSLADSGKAQAAILIAKSLQGLDIESYSIAVAERWKLGKKNTDNGLLIVVAPQERKMRFEVGYGLEGVLTDAETKRIQEVVVVPFFRDRRYGDGLLAALLAVEERLGVEVSSAASSAPPMAPQPAESPSASRGFPFLFIFLFFMLLLFLLRRVGSARRGFWGPGIGGTWGGSSGWGSGSSWSSGGGSSWGGGGGGFGGGGSSSSW